MTEDEEAELLSFTGKTIDGKLYVDFEDFDRLRRFVSNYLEKGSRHLDFAIHSGMFNLLGAGVPTYPNFC